MTPTSEQLSIISTTSSSPASIMIRAYAGTAKTTTLQLAAPNVKVPSLALAFNRKIAQELTPRLPSNFTVKTLNGLGHMAWARQIDVPSIRLQDRKLGKLVTAVAKDQRVNLPSWQWDAVRQLVSKAMLAGIVPNNAGDFLTPDTPEAWSDLDDSGESPQDFSLTLDLARQVLTTSNHLAHQGDISFDDQIYCPVVFGGKWPLYPFVMVDEAQDLSTLNHTMLSRVLRPGGRLVAVGDPKQAIYAFRGADSTSMDSIRGLQPSWVDHSLTITFRCPKSIVARQQSHAPGYTAFQDNPEGSFLSTPEISGEGETPYWDFSTVRRNFAPNTSSVAVLCRNNAPLLKLAFKLLKSGTGCQMLGRDIGKGLQQLLKKLCPDDSLPISRVLSIVEDWRETQVSQARANEKPSKEEQANDRADCLVAVAEGASCRTASDLSVALEKLFARDVDPIILSTIHRAKGLEFPTVIHLDPWRVPSRRAVLKGGSELEQELNLLYVCETRTKHTLINADLSSFR